MKAEYRINNMVLDITRIHPALIGKDKKVKMMKNGRLNFKKRKMK
jgi:hypothetical protein